MQGRTYKYIEDEPLYPFGYGLSFTEFTYNNLQLNPEFKTGDKIELKVTVSNTGNLDGDEVVQVYASLKDDDPNSAIRTLVAFERIHLNKGESQELTFTIEPRQLSIINQNSDRVLEPGEIVFSVGGGQPIEKYKKLNHFVSGKTNIMGEEMEFKH